MTKAVLFDMDGVIVDTENLHFESYRQMIEELSMDLTKLEYKSIFSGKTATHGVSDYFKTHGISDDVESAVRRKIAIFHELSESNLTAYPNTIDTIKTLSANYPIALVTSARRNVVDHILERFKIDHFFTEIITADDVTNGKPDPEGYKLAASRLQVPIEDCVVIEDSSQGISAAKSAGAHCIALTTTHSKAELQDADVIVDTLTSELFA